MPDRPSVTEELALTTSRRGLLSRVGAALLGATAGSAVKAVIDPGEADAYHFCGHIYTTDSCPHPTGLPRIDARGYPLRAKDGKRIDNTGRIVNREGEPVDERGRVLTDADGRPLAPAPRTPICDQVADRFRIRTKVDGAWYRCCGGRVRKLIDCCSPSRKRINGDASLTGYCYKGRRVFCVMYYDTKIRC
jgi:hypothetical protein